MADQIGSRDEGAGAESGHGRDGDQRDAQGRPSLEAVAKRNSAWSQAEHLLYLLGLDNHGRGAWRAIAANYCISRTPTQVASHAQKYFRRQELSSWQRHKKRPSIHDITCGSIHPSATAADRNAVRIALQKIVSEGRDTDSSSDSPADAGATSRNKAALSSYLPIQDPSFAQVFAFTNDAGSMSTSGSTNEGSTRHTASPHPLQYPAIPPVPMVQLPPGYSHSNEWAVVPLAGNMASPEPPHHAEGMYLQPVVYATDQVQQPQDQLPYIVPGFDPGTHSLPQQHIVLEAAPEMHASFVGHVAPTNAFPDATQNVFPMAQTASSSAPAVVAMVPGPQQVAGLEHVGVLAAPAGTPAFDASHVMQPSLQPLVPRPLSAPPAPWNAAGSDGHDRGTKREGFAGGEQWQRTGQQRPRALPLKLANGAFGPLAHAALGLPIPPQPGLPYRPPQHPLRHPHARPPVPAPPLADAPPWTASVTMPENSLRPGPVYDSSACTISMPMSMPTNSVGVSAGYAVSGPSSSRGGGLPPTSLSGQSVTMRRPFDVHGSAGTGGDDGGSTTGNDTAFTDASTGTRPPANGNSYGSYGSGHASVALPPPARHLSVARPAPPGHGQRGDHPQDIRDERMHGMHDAPPPNGQNGPRLQDTLRAQAGTPNSVPASRAAQTNVLPHFHAQVSAPQNAVAGVADMLTKPPQPPPQPRAPAPQALVGGHSAPFSTEVFVDPLAADQDDAQRPRFMPDLSPGPPQDSLEDLAQNLLGSSTDPGDSACIGAYSWERSGTGGGGGGGGGSGSDGSNGANSRRAFLTRRRSLP